MMSISRYLISFCLTLCYVSPAFAINCPPLQPLLSPSLTENEIAEVTVIDHVTLEADDPRNPADSKAISAIAVQVGKIYQGELLETGVVLIASFDFWGCDVVVANLPIGGRYIFALESTEEGTYVAASLVESPKITNGTVQITRSLECRLELGCISIRETMSLADFDNLQEVYFDGARAGAQYEARKLPYFNLDSSELSMPTVRLYADQSAISSREQPLGVVEAELRLVSGGNGNLQFSIERLGSK